MARNLVDALLDELERVIGLRDRVRDLTERNHLGIDFTAAVGVLTEAIDAAKAAIGGNDAVACLRAHAVLKNIILTESCTDG